MQAESGLCLWRRASPAFLAPFRCVRPRRVPSVRRAAASKPRCRRMEKRGGRPPSARSAPPPDRLAALFARPRGCQPPAPRMPPLLWEMGEESGRCRAATASNRSSALRSAPPSRSRPRITLPSSSRQLVTLQIHAAIVKSSPTRAYHRRCRPSSSSSPARVPRSSVGGSTASSTTTVSPCWLCRLMAAD